MTKTTSEKIAVMQAFERGEKIERLSERPNDVWRCDDDPIWDWQYLDYRIAAPEPVPHTIDWSHVSDEFICLVKTSYGDHFLATRTPEDGIDTWIWPPDVVMVLAYSHASFKAGNMTWQESLVVRPVDAKK